MIGSLAKNEGDRKKLSKVILPSFFIHFIAGLLYILTFLILTRKLGARQYGILTYSFAIVTLIANLSMSGINLMAVREPAALLSTRKTGLWKGFYLWSFRFVMVVCITIPLLAAGFIWSATWVFHIMNPSVYTLPILFALAAVPFYCLMMYYSSWLRGQYKTVLSFLPDNIIKPAFFLVILISLFQFNIWTAILARDLSFAAAFLFAIVAFFRTTKTGGIKPEYNTPAWKSSLKALFLLIALGSINSRLDIIMLGFFKNASQVGIYNGADRVAASIAIFQILMNQISAPSISRLHALNDMKKMQELVTKITRWVTLLSLLVFLVLLFSGKSILAYLGANFIHGETALIIICFGQLVGVAFGPVGNFTITTKNEKINIFFALLKMALIILLNIILIPIMGINGTAIATAISIILGNAGMFIIIKRKTGISTWVFGKTAVKKHPLNSGT